MTMLSFACPYDSTQMLLGDSYYKCSTCGMTFPVREGVADFLRDELDPVSDKERQLRDEQIAPEGEDYGSPIRNRVETEFITDHLGAREGDLILDIGCGKGRASLPLLKKIRVRLTGLDFSWPALAAFRRKAPGGSELLLARADVAHMPVSPETFDRAICSMLLPSLPTTELVESVLAGSFRALKPGGKIVFTVFNYGRLARRLGYPKTGHFPGTQVLIRHFNPDELRDTLSRYFTVERVVGLVHGVPKITTPIDRFGLPGIKINALIDHGWRLVPALRDYADVLGAVCHKPS
jgi:SAM-dependent methyltransferase